MEVLPSEPYREEVGGGGGGGGVAKQEAHLW